MFLLLCCSLQITKQEDLKSSCDDFQLCIIAFLPHILDCQSECRNKFIDILKVESEKFKKQKWRY